MKFLLAMFHYDFPKRVRRLKKNSLLFEPLECRRLLAATDLRFVTYNALNFDSSSSSRQDEMEIIFADIEADVLAIQEVNTAGGADILLDALNAGGQEYARGDFIDGPDTDSVIYYRTSKVDLVSQNYIATSLRSIGEYTLSVADTLFNVYSLHMKASSGGSNEQARLSEATLLRDHLETLPSDREFLVVGDMNIYSSSEPAYQKFVQSESNNDGRVEDLLLPSQIGNWHVNSAFASVHTQSPRTASFGGGSNGGLDDRFDMIFSSFGLNDNAGLEYVSGSQFVHGNDGQHFNQSILSGSNSAVSQAVRQALHDASDHLPVVADFEVFTSFGVTVAESNGSTAVSENGTADSYALVLDSVPTSDVTIVVTPDAEVDLGSGAAVAISLTFTPANALTPQTVSVLAIDDLDTEGLHFSTLVHSVTSSDADYDGVAVDSVSVSITDNDGTTASSVLLNEIFANNPGTDSNLEYVEILGTPSSLLTDIWLLEIEGDGTAAGTIDNAQNLSSIATGSNGLVLLGDGYSSSTPWGSEISPSTTLANLEGETIENGSLTFMLVQGFTGSFGIDLDANNDGQFDFTPWSLILDGVGWTDGGSSDHVYVSASLAQDGNPDAATRVYGDDQSDSLSSWFNGDVAGTVTYAQGSSNLPTNAVLTPGAANFGATAPSLSSVDINNAEAQRSSINQLVLTFDGLVDFESDAFRIIQRSDGDGVATGVLVTTSFSDIEVASNTVVTLTFDSLTRNAMGALLDGNYQLTVDGTKVKRFGTDLTMGTDFVYGDVAAENFYSFFGDASGDRNVNVFDLLSFRQTYLSQTGDSNFNASLDSNGDGNVNVFDLLSFRQNYLESLPFV